MTDKQMIRVLIVDDHAMVRRGISTFLKTAPDIELVGEAPNGEVALAMCEKYTPDVVLMDVHMPGMSGIETTRKLRDRYPDTQIVAVTSFGDEEVVEEAIQAGAISYIFKDVTAETLVDAIRAAHAGEPRMSPKAMEALIGAMKRPPGPGHDLTPRELEVLECMVAGLNNAEIADELFVSRSTIKTHVSNILSKLEVSGRVEAVTIALQHKLVEPPNIG